jgi:ADP-heptose:LPS heptosyltransferase
VVDRGDRGFVKIILRNSQSPGDIVILTAAVRDLHRVLDRQSFIDVRTPCSALWEHNPYLRAVPDAEGESIECHYPLVHRSNSEPWHFIHGFHQYLSEQLGLRVEPGEFKGDIHLSEQETRSPSPLIKRAGQGLPFWLLVAGGKYDFTAKWWDPARYQAVVDGLRGKVLFVQVGEAGHHHPPLRGVIDLRGKTSLRELILLVYHAQGVICPVTLAMHLAAAVPRRNDMPANRPCVVIAGGREPMQWEAYPHHQYIHTNGALVCCEQGGCWKSRVIPLGDGDPKDRSLCSNVVRVSEQDGLRIREAAVPGECFAQKPGTRPLPRCLDMISAEEVVRRTQLYFEGGVVKSLSRAEARLCAERIPALGWKSLLNVTVNGADFESETSDASEPEDHVENQKLTTDIVSVFKDSPRPQVTICVLVTGQNPAFLRRSLESIRRHCPPGEHELFVASNGVSPNVRETLRRLKAARTVDRWEEQRGHATPSDLFGRLAPHACADLVMACADNVLLQSNSVWITALARLSEPKRGRLFLVIPTGTTSKLGEQINPNAGCWIGDKAAVARVFSSAEGPLEDCDVVACAGLAIVEARSVSPKVAQLGATPRSRVETHAAASESENQVEPMHGLKPDAKPLPILQRIALPEDARIEDPLLTIGGECRLDLKRDAKQTGANRVLAMPQMLREPPDCGLPGETQDATVPARMASRHEAVAGRVMFIACNGTYESGHKIGDMITMAHAARVIAANEPHDTYVLSLNRDEPLNFIFDQFVKDFSVQVIFDDWPKDAPAWTMPDFEKRRLNRCVKGLNFTTYKELYRRIDGQARQALLCREERGVGRRNIFEYYFFGQEESPVACLNSEGFGPESFGLSWQPDASPTTVFVAPHEVCQRNAFFTLEFWSSVVDALLQAGLEVIVNTPQQGLFGERENLQYSYHPNDLKKLFDTVSKQRLVVCGNTGVGWIAAACGVPMIAGECPTADLMDYGYRRCGVRSLVGVFEAPDVDYVCALILAQCGRPKDAKALNANATHAPHKLLEVDFPHGLGDCANFAHALVLYQRRGYDIRARVTPDKDFLFRTIGSTPALRPQAMVPWFHGEDIRKLDATNHWRANKTFINLALPPLPKLGPLTGELWEELSNVSINGLTDIPPSAFTEVDQFLATIARPFILVHTMGNTSQGAKSVPRELALEIYREILEQTGGSILLLDWDNRVPRLAHGRVRHLCDDWKRLDIPELLATISRADLFVGVDSGPLHLCRFTKTPAVGLWFSDHHPALFSLPRSNQVNVTLKREMHHANRISRWAYNIVEDSAERMRPSLVGKCCSQMLRPTRYCPPGQIGRDVMIRHWVTELVRGGFTYQETFVDRDVGFDLVLRHAAQFEHPVFVETGCIRGEEDWLGTGFATYLFGAFITSREGSLVSVDISEANCAFARKYTECFGSRVSVVCQDSVAYLSNRRSPVDVLYLDSWDADLPGAAEHGLREIEAAVGLLHERSLVVYDDTSRKAGKWIGKGALGVPWMMDRGWKPIHIGHQVLLVRSNGQWPRHDAGSVAVE